MFSDANFVIRGIGYLHDVVLNANEVSIKVNVVHLFNSGAQHEDDIWINCVVKDVKLFRLLLDLKNQLRKNKIVILDFNIQYLDFEFYQNDMTDDVSAHSIFLKGHLQHIEKYFIDGVRDERISLLEVKYHIS